MYAFGIDIGGTKIKIGVFTSQHKLIDKWSIDTNSKSLFEDLAKTIRNYCEDKCIIRKEIMGYGIGIPGYVKNNVALNCVNLGWKNIDVVKEFKKAIGYDAKVAVMNDAKLAAYGEYVTKGKYNSIVFVTLGTGIGGGIITDGVIQEGAHGLCGEIGHIIADSEGLFQCSCGKRGCFETVASATGILKLANYYLEKSDLSIGHNYFLSAKDVIDEAKKGNEIAVMAIDKAASYIGKVLATLSLAINPNAFIIGGGVSEAGDFLLKKIKKHYLNECFIGANDVDIEISQLKNDAGIYGASMLIIKKQ